MTSLIKTLKARGFIEAVTHDGLDAMCQKPLKVYCGFDPTGDSLHLGHLVAVMGLAWFQKFGHAPVALIGGATGMVGDPSGKAKERKLLDETTIAHNIQGIQSCLEKVLKTDDANPPIILNNYNWLEKFSMIAFLRDVGKYFRLGPMLAKESVRQRLNSEEGMSFTEFSYQLLQAYDFFYLREHFSVKVQLGGSDQWGNITAGIDLMRKVKGLDGYGITFPLLTTSDGKKFGKSEKGAIWLSSEKLSPYEFYQYLVRISDHDVIRLLKLLTFVEIEEIESLEASMQTPSYKPNTAQKYLAEEVTRIVHGEEGLQVALKVTQAAKPGGATVLDKTILEAVASEMPSTVREKKALLNMKILDLLVDVNLQSSKGQARRLLLNGGVYLNNKKIENVEQIVLESDLIDKEYLLLAAGKKNKLLIRVEG